MLLQRQVYAEKIVTSRFPESATEIRKSMEEELRAEARKVWAGTGEPVLEILWAPRKEDDSVDYYKAMVIVASAHIEDALRGKWDTIFYPFKATDDVIQVMSKDITLPWKSVRLTDLSCRLNMESGQFWTT